MRPKIEEEDYIKEIEQLKKKVAQLVQDLIDANKQLKDKQEETRSQKKLISEKDGEITTLGLKLDQTQYQLKQKEKQIKDDKAQNDNFKIQMDEMINMMKSESEQTKTKLNIKDHILKKLSKQIQDDKYLDKISGLMEKIMQTEYKIYQFTKELGLMGIQCPLKSYSSLFSMLLIFIQVTIQSMKIQYIVY